MDADNAVIVETPENEAFQVYPDEYQVTGDAAHDLASCRICGCSALQPCPGGCVWATEELCSSCVQVSV